VFDTPNWFPCSAYWGPQLFMPNQSRGPWVFEIVPSTRPQEPIEFYEVSDGRFGPVLHPHGLVLVRDDLLAVLREACGSSFATYRAAIGPVRSEHRRNDYSVIKPSESISRDAILMPLTGPVLVALADYSGTFVVSTALREIIESHHIEGIEFEPTIFVE